LIHFSDYYFPLENNILNVDITLVGQINMKGVSLFDF